MTTTQLPLCQVRFTLPQHHRDQEITNWRQIPHRLTSLAHSNNTQNPPQPRLKEQRVKQGVLEGYITSEAWDTVCTSHTGMLRYLFIQIEQRSAKIFALSDGHPTPATHRAKLEHRVCEPAHTFNMVPALDN